MSQHVQFGPNDYSPYHGGYISLVQDKDLHEFLPFQRERLFAMFDGISEERGDYAYAPGKWTIKEVLQHINDTERVFAFRLLALGRGETQAIPGFEQDDYANAVNVANRSLEGLVTEFGIIRQGSIALYENLSPEAFLHRGTVNNHPLLTAALPYILAGHVEHHMNILRERYAL